jgi:pectinesterase
LTGLSGTATRPTLTDAQAANYTILKYLEKAGSISAGLVADDWDPRAGVGDVSAFSPQYTVGASGGTHTTVQAAVTAAAGGTSRVYIRVLPGTYREVVCVPPTAPPITLYSTTADASQTVVVFNNYSGNTVTATSPANPCPGPASNGTYGTAGSATFAAFAAGFQAKNITFSNDVTGAMLGTTAGTQAVALMTRTDQVILENVRALGHQDTLYLETPSADTVVRVYIKGSFIAGDTDFIFGGATAVMDTSQIQSVTDRAGSKGQPLAPDTGSSNPYGFLVLNSAFTADAGATAASMALGRAWDRSCKTVDYYAATCVSTPPYPNGQAVVRDSTLGPHIKTAAGTWAAAATTSRGFSTTPWACSTSGNCPANRLCEYNDTP